MSFTIPYAPTQLYQQPNKISDLLMRMGEVQAEGQRRSGAIWGGALSNLGNTIADTLTEIRRQKQNAPLIAAETAQRLGQAQLTQQQVAEGQNKQRLSDVMANQSTMASQGQEMTPESISQNLNANGLGQYTDQVLKAHEETKSLIQKQYETTNHTMAGFADNLGQFVGTPLFGTLADQAAARLKGVVPGIEQQVAQLKQMPPDQQKQALGFMVSQSETYKQQKAQEDKANRFSQAEGTTLGHYGPDGKAIIDLEGTPKVAVGEEKYAAAAKALGLKSASDLSLAQRLEVDRQEAAAKRDPSAEIARQGARQDAATEKSYQFHIGQLEKVRKPLDDKAQKLAELDDVANSATPVADSVLAAKFMTAMAGGQGSGVRVTGAEINNIQGGRSVWEGLKAKLQKFSTDPKNAGSFTPEQRRQIKELSDLMQGQLKDKISKANLAQQALTSATDPRQHKQILTDFQSSLNSSARPANETPAPSRPASSAGGWVLGPDGVWTKK